MDIAHLPTCAGIYAIVNRMNGDRYVGQAENIRRRVQQHLKNLRAGREHSNSELLLQKAWDQFGAESFDALVLAVVENNKGAVNYDIRPDNLSLAEHWYINERADYNADTRIVRDEFAHLIESKGWQSTSEVPRIAESPP